MSDYYGSIEWQINLMFNREEDSAREREDVLERMRSGMDGDILLPEGDPNEIEDYVNCPEPTNVCNTCEHGLYHTEGVRSGIGYHLNEDIYLWEVCDEDVDVEQWEKEGRPLTQPIDGLS